MSKFAHDHSDFPCLFCGWNVVINFHVPTAPFNMWQKCSSRIAFLVRFSLFKRPVLLIWPFLHICIQGWKNLGQLNTLKFTQTLTLKSTIFTQLTENIFELHQISIPIQILSCKNYFQWGVWMICNLHYKIWPIDFNGESGQSGRLWICSNNVGLISTMIVELGKDLGLLPWLSESITLIGTIKYKRFHILLTLL